MYNVLTIDLDFIAEPYIQLYYELCFEPSVERTWDQVFSNPALVGSNFDINPDNLIYALDTFTRSLAKCKNVAFGITHDSIMYELEDKDKINLVNIDHHHDIIYGEWFMREGAMKYGIVSEGNWIEHLHQKSKIEDYVWIRNENSFMMDDTQHPTREPMKWATYLKTEYKYEMTPDYIFVCLSPAYIPKFHWFYFKIFMNLYKVFYEGEPKFYKKPYKNNLYSNPKRGYEDFLQEVTT